MLALQKELKALLDRPDESPGQRLVQREAFVQADTLDETCEFK